MSMDTGLIPRISGEFDSASFRAGPAPLPEPDVHPSGDVVSYLPEEEVPSTARGHALRDEIPLPGRRTFQGKTGQNPYFKSGRKKKITAYPICPAPSHPAVAQHRLGSKKNKGSCRSGSTGLPEVFPR